MLLQVSYFEKYIIKEVLSNNNNGKNERICYESYHKNERKTEKEMVR